jgi:hypothetical protein
MCSEHVNSVHTFDAPASTTSHFVSLWRFCMLGRKDSITSLDMSAAGTRFRSRRRESGKGMSEVEYVRVYSRHHRGSIG